MASSSGGGDTSSTRLEKFDGSDPSLYRRWKRRAALSLVALPSTFAAEKLGPKLMESLSGEAELAVEHIPLEDLCKSGGERLIFAALDERYKALEKDEMAEALREYFQELTVKPGELMKNFVTRLATAERKLQEQGVNLPTEVQGWFMLRKMRLDTTSEAMILTATQGSYKVEAVIRAVRAVLPNQRGSSRSKETLVADAGSGEREVEESGDSDQEVLDILVADMQYGEQYDEESVLESFENYKQVRNRMLEAKKGRGYRGPAAVGTSGKSAGKGGTGSWRLQGSITAKVEQMKARTRCHLCGQLGHWKRDCPRKKAGGSSDPAASGGSSKEVHLVEAGMSVEEVMDDLLREVDQGTDFTYEVHEAVERKALGQGESAPSSAILNMSRNSEVPEFREFLIGCGSKGARFRDQRIRNK